MGERLCKHKYSAYCVTDVESKLDDDRLKSDQGKPDEVDITNVEDTNDHCCNSSPSKVLQQQLHEHEAHGDCEREAMLQEVGSCEFI